MDYLSYSVLPARKRAAYAALLQACGFVDENDSELTILAEDETGALCGCGSLRGNVLKQIAVSPAAESGGQAAAIVSRLVTEAFRRGETHLFLFTKPQHSAMFGSLGFYPMFQTDGVLMMENRAQGFSCFLQSLRAEMGGAADGAVVCNCNPFTLGHRHLLAYAAAHCRRLVVFVLSEDQSLIPAEDRFRLVREGTADLANVHVVRSRAYLISRATFPMYFLKDQSRADDVRADLDLLLFAGPIAAALGIRRRFVGAEPFDAVTRAYNQRMKELLPAHGVEVTEIPRFQDISASQVRRLLLAGQVGQIRDMVPEHTYAYCKSQFS